MRHRPAAGGQLHGLGIFTCGQLARFPLEILRKKYGVIGDRLHAMARGIDPSPVVPEDESAPIKSVGHSRTLRDDLIDRQAICAFLLQLAEMVGRRARRYQVSGRVVTLTVRYADFTTCSRQQVQADYLDCSEQIYRASVKILEGVPLDQPVRLLGVRLSSLRFKTGQLPLFPQERRQSLLTEARDCVNDRYGDFTVMFGGQPAGPEGEGQPRHLSGLAAERCTQRRRTIKVTTYGSKGLFVDLARASPIRFP